MLTAYVWDRSNRDGVLWLLPQTAIDWIRRMGTELACHVPAEVESVSPDKLEALLVVTEPRPKAVAFFTALQALDPDRRDPPSWVVARVEREVDWGWAARVDQDLARWDLPYSEDILKKRGSWHPDQ